MSNAKLIVLYPQPTDAGQFDKAYEEEHIPLMRQKLKGMKVAVTKIEGAAGGEAPYYLMAEIFAPSLDAIKAFLGTADGKEVGANAAKISTGGRPVVLFSNEDVHQL
jgi:uncharacterized protein (TIGR02118 family)